MEVQGLQFRKSQVVNTLFTVVFFLFVAFAGSAQAQMDVNPNGSFDSSAVTIGDDTSSVQGWTFEVGGDAQATFQIVDDVVQHGSRALKIRVDSVGSNSWDVQAINELFFIEPGVTYTMSAWARTDTTPEAMAHFTAGNPAFNEFGRVHNATITNNWQRYSFSFNVPAGNDTGRVPIHFSLAGNEGVTFYLDHVRVESPYNNTNGSFEASAVTVGADTSGIPGWSFNLGGDADANFRIVDDTVKSGNRAIAISVNAIGTNPWHVELLSTDIVVEPGSQYRYAVWARSDQSGATGHFTVGNPSFQEFLRIERNGALDTTWREITGTFTVPEDDPPIARGPIHFGFSQNVGKTMYVDSLRISEVETPADVPVVFEAEEAAMAGAEWDTLGSGDSTYLAISTDYNETTGSADYPGENRTATYEVTFPATGTYDLFARLRVGPNTYDDDSFFYGWGFGEKHPDSSSAWVMMNGMAAAGFSTPSAVVREPGGLGEGVWKWVNLSRNPFQGDTSLQFEVDNPDDLTETFMIGARENGLHLDKFAFGKSDLYFTVENLDNGEAGSEFNPEPPYDQPIAQGKGKWLGNVYSPSQLTWYTAFWNQVTPENAGKWGSVEGSRDQMNWSSLDEAYNLAKDNGYRYRHHVLIWGNQQPNWIEDLPTEEQEAEIREWFEAVANRYPDIDYLEVVNEPLHDPPRGEGNGNYIQALGGSGETGWDWIINAFQMAREVFPDSVNLMINDYGIVGDPSATQDYLEIINLLQDRDLIDGIGVQAHAFSTRGEASTMQTNLNSLSETGLPVQATELDIDGPTDQQQLEDYQRIFPVFWEHPGVEGVTLWGWRPGMWRTDEQAYLITNAGELRPALEWLRSYVDSVSVGIEDEKVAGLPTEYRIYNNYPNPFNPTTNIRFDVPKASEVTLKVYDLTGRQVRTLVSERKEPGTYTVNFNAGNLSSGLYLYRLQAGSYTEVKRMMLIK